jgi:uncharacterized integral membrane protein (TIGR00697 family)
MIIIDKKIKVLIILSTAYVTVKLLAIVLFYKSISILGMNAASSTLIIPFWFLLGDVITEIYGYKISRILVYIAAVYQMLFGVVLYGFAKLPSNHALNIDQSAYNLVMHNMLQASSASVLAIIFGGISNAFLFNKCKILLSGRYFVIRSFLATSIGELVFTIAVYAIGMFNHTNFTVLIKMVAVSFIMKVIANNIFIIPIVFLVSYIKKIIK